MKLLLLRHGQTEENVAHVIQGQSPGTLTSDGILQAKAVAERLRSEQIAHIYSSDLKRVRDTLSEILPYHPLEVTYTKLLRERGFGVYEGKTADEYYELRTASDVSRIEFRPEGGENYLDVRARVLKFLETLKVSHSNQTVLACTHGGTIRMFLSILLGYTLDQALDTPIDNTSISTFEFSENGQLINHYVNCMSHLNHDYPQTGIVR